MKKKLAFIILAFFFSFTSFAQDTCNVFIEKDYSNGTLNAIASNDIGSNFTYSWSTGQTTQSISPTATGVYGVTATSQNGCIANTSLDLQCHFPGWISHDTNFDSTTSTISFNIEFPWLMEPISYLWNTGETSNIVTIPFVLGYIYTLVGTDAIGCTSQYNWAYYGECEASIEENGSELTAFSTGVSPFTYLWSTEDTTQTINTTPNQIYYWVIVTDANNCSSWESNNKCETSISQNQNTLTANVNGSLPTSYLWNTGDTTQTIIPTSPGTYSITTTSGSNCTSEASYEFICSSYFFFDLYGQYSGDSVIISHSMSGYPPFTYLWNTGDTLPSITVSQGTYSLTITNVNGCTKSESITVDPALTEIRGHVYPIPARAYLIDYDSIMGTLTAIDSFDMTQDSNKFVFLNLPKDHQYLVKAAPLPLFTPTNHFPTYYHSALFWNDAEYIIPNFTVIKPHINLIEGNNPGGPGFIGGLISEGANFTHSGNSSESEGDPIAHQIIHLIKPNGDPVTYTFTDANGTFSFDNIAYGTYKIVLDILNKTQAYQYITLNADYNSANINFEVNEDNIVLGDIQLTPTKSTFTVSPNPATNEINVHFQSPSKVDAVIYITDITGKTLLSESTTLAAKTGIKLNISQLPKGTYFINLLSNNKVLTQKMTKL